MYNPKSKIATEFIDDQEILDTLAFADKNKTNQVLIHHLLIKLQIVQDLHTVKLLFF